MLNSGIKIGLCATKKINILTLINHCIIPNACEIFQILMQNFDFSALQINNL
jgi:hypothetical protein